MKHKLRKTFAALICAGTVACGAHALAGEPAISINYNGDNITFTDALPESVNDRTMLPFRAVLENLGAEVSYDETSNTVTAVKDDTTVSFAIDSADINITNAEGSSVITSDVAPYERDGRTYVPVRFVSNALGLKVGWNEYSQTVYIVDPEVYFAEFEQNCPNFMKLFELNTVNPEKYTGNVKMKLDMALLNEMSFVIDMTADEQGADGSSKGTLKANVSAYAENLSEEEKKIMEKISAGTVEYIQADDVLYLRFSGMEGLSEYMPDLEPISNGVWYKLDTAQLFEELGLSEMVHSLDAMSAIDMTEKSGDFETFKSLLSAMMFTEDGSIVPGMEELFDVMMTEYKVMDKYITVTESDGKTEVAMKIDNSIFAELYKEMGMDPEMLGDMPMDMNMTMTMSIADNVAANTAVTFYMNGEGMTFSMDMSSAITPDASVESITPPADAVDLIKVIEQYENTAV